MPPTNDSLEWSDSAGLRIADLETHPLTAVYRHDVHKLRGRSHDAAADEIAGIRVNETVPLHADRDAALLSRPEGRPEQTVDNHLSPARLSLLTGEPIATRLPRDTETIVDLIEPTDPAELHATWLTSTTPAAYNESVYYPYTSLKFHTLLAGALLDNYRAGHTFDELWLTATPTAPAEHTPEGALASEAVDPHRTILWAPPLALHVTATPGDRPATRLGAHPTRSFADVWTSLPYHPIDVDSERQWRLLDAQLRRIRSWSTALQFIEEFVTEHASSGGERRAI
ncbi:hypothetical protein [Natrarchaeobaculum sulfurireducens]|uniref:DUF8168 domain-containing protein n=1 Tax=Natrarchaeobaculum sulfurireducens TaxID=2044521 RepID=A0A346PK54_9EURY|nr:hypothetical protein [Natrarchaeobaculum sulfurireducens]AXR79899.1 hypothetical protein AArcMg_4074 [Natrarchaeobaculum sulfurireducens]